MKFTTWLIVTDALFLVSVKTFFKHCLINREMKIKGIGKFIWYIIGAIFFVLLITLWICYNKRKCCLRNHGRQSQDPAHIIRSSNQTVKTVTGNAQPMTPNLPTQGHPSQSQMQSPEYCQQPAYNPGKTEVLPFKELNYSPQKLELIKYKYSAFANFGHPNYQYIPSAGLVRY